MRVNTMLDNIQTCQRFTVQSFEIHGARLRVDKNLPNATTTSTWRKPDGFSMVMVIERQNDKIFVYIDGSKPLNFAEVEDGTDSDWPQSKWGRANFKLIGNSLIYSLG